MRWQLPLKKIIKQRFDHQSVEQPDQDRDGYGKHRNRRDGHQPVVEAEPELVIEVDWYACGLICRPDNDVYRGVDNQDNPQDEIVKPEREM